MQVVKIAVIIGNQDSIFANAVCLMHGILITAQPNIAGDLYVVPISPQRLDQSA